MSQIAEKERLEAARDGRAPWREWGPYLSERQWGTVREDYSEGGDAWNYFSHDQARSRAYHWGEDGLGGISDDKQRLCFALALWNDKDPILKERLFGVTNGEGNHGEDVKEYYFYLDSTPTHSYMRYLYKYPQAPYPYDDLLAVNRQRSRGDLEYELIDTGIFDKDRYFDVEVEYAKAAPEVLFTENETNAARLRGTPNACPWVKDAFHEYVVHGRRDAVNPERTGTKTAAHYPVLVEAEQAVEIRLRLTAAPPDAVVDGE